MLGVNGGGQLRAHRGQVGVDLQAVAPPGPGQQRRGQYLCLRGVLGFRARERHRKAQLGHRHGTAAHRENP